MGVKERWGEGIIKSAIFHFCINHRLLGCTDKDVCQCKHLTPGWFSIKVVMIKRFHFEGGTETFFFLCVENFFSTREYRGMIIGSIGDSRFGNF